MSHYQFTLRMLLVVDGYFSLGPRDDNDRSFSIAHLINVLKSATMKNNIRLFLDTAHRDGDSNATILGKFDFEKSVPDLSIYDEIWLFGYNGWNANDPENIKFKQAVRPEEVDAIARFMQKGGGILADGDHDSLGSYMCANIPRVRTMRKWFAKKDDSDFCKQALANNPKAPRNWPAQGEDRADTLQANEDGTYDFTNQSDDKPQPLTLLPYGDKPHHQIFDISANGKDSVLRTYPDHFHEGEVLGMGGVEGSEPWSLKETFVVDGKTCEEYPMYNGAQLLPQIIATGHVIGGHATNVEGDKLCDSGFRPDSSKTKEKQINTLSVFDGRPLGIGRVMTDSSFHHFTDLNLIGDPCAGSELKTMGFGRQYLNEMTAFYLNCATWLARETVFQPKPEGG